MPNYKPPATIEELLRILQVWSTIKGDPNLPRMLIGELDTESYIAYNLDGAKSAALHCQTEADALGIKVAELTKQLLADPTNRRVAHGLSNTKDELERVNDHKRDAENMIARIATL